MKNKKIIVASERYFSEIHSLITPGEIADTVVESEEPEVLFANTNVTRIGIQSGIAPSLSITQLEHFTKSMGTCAARIYSSEEKNLCRSLNIYSLDTDPITIIHDNILRFVNSPQDPIVLVPNVTFSSVNNPHGSSCDLENQTALLLGICVKTESHSDARLTAYPRAVVAVLKDETMYAGLIHLVPYADVLILGYCMRIYQHHSSVLKVFLDVMNGSLGWKDY